MTTATICPGCHDTGWFSFVPASEQFARTVRCACLLGSLRRRGADAPFADLVPEDQWRAAWPSGLPVPSDEWCTPGLLMHAGVPTEMRGWTRASYPNPTSDKVAMADAWIAERGRRSDAVLFGSHGTGKSGLVIVMLRGALVRGASCRYVLASDLLRDIRQTYRPDAERTERDVLDSVASPDVLVLDELNVKTTEFAEDTFNWLIETRHRAQKATLITTNIGGSLSDEGDAFAALQAYLGPLIVDRLRERAQFWQMNGESLRPTYGEAH